MAVSRKDWSALSSLARQWTLEDEEEQERERRRRHRNLSSTTDDEAPKPAQNGDTPATQRLPSVEEAEAPRPRTSASKDEDEDIQAILRTRQERRQRRQVVEPVQAPSPPETEEVRDGSGSGPAKQQPLVPKEVEPPPPRRLSWERRGPWAREEESVAVRESEGRKKEASEKPVVSEKPPVPGKTLVLGKRLVSEETSNSEKAWGPEKTSRSEKAVSEKKSILEKTSVSDKPPAPGKTSDLERKTVSEKALLFEKSLVSEKTLATETKLATKRAAAPGRPRAEEQLAPGGSPPPATTGQSGKALPEKSSQSLAELGEKGAPDRPTAASRLPPITFQVKVPSKEEEVSPLSPTQATYSSSLKRSSPRTISFRMSPRKDNSETTLTRSASMRLPAGAVKLGEKLERYHTAIQRSESVKAPGSSRTEFFVAPVGVASKRHLFEKELVGQSRAEPASSRKENLKLSGVVTSRLNLWISRTQESGDQDPQDVRKESAATKRTQWGKKAESSLDAEV